MQTYHLHPAELFAEGNLLNGQKIKTNGFINLSHEDYSLYLSKEDCEYRNVYGRIWLNIDNNLLDKIVFDRNSCTYSEIYGHFKKKNEFNFTRKNGYGHGGRWKYQIGVIKILDKSDWKNKTKKDRESLSN